MSEQSLLKRMVLIALDGGLIRSFEDSAQDVERLVGVISKLQEKDVPVVVFTGCDRAEVEPIRSKLGLSAPFIVESGSAIFASAEGHPFDTEMGEKENGYFVVTLGCPYVQARAGLRVIANEISHPLKGFGDFTVPQLERAAKLSEGAAHRAKAREFSEPFMTPKAVEADVLCKAAVDMGFDVILRPETESRFSELVGAGAGLDKALQLLVEAYGATAGEGRSLDVVMVTARPDGFTALNKVSELVGGIKVTEVLVDGLTVNNCAEAIASILNS